MKEVRSMEELKLQMSNMNKEDSICQFFFPGKGRFIIVLQELDEVIQNDLEQMVSSESEKKGHVMLASEIMRNPFI
ncbi:hypothetical protein [Paenibacillus qinlingensis]|uniref:Uncharacterized protein n=1 Tax=Paenibacillus qinlingensis TaxID=1837343 RepID=A0ABU1NTA8_9BACL|nr:hypothetical protein [Paenibacillus qinlingensis]MDR6550725.1 hypothetical protein [Paenibacillus qinlingensis]